MKVVEYLKKYNANGFFILDSHQEAMSDQETGHQYADSDYIGYAYNVHQYNQLKPGDFFLYRRPGKLSTDGKFHIYGGGVIDSIINIDNDGNVVANIAHAFRLKETLDQGDEYLENYVWKTREKPGPGWKGFWINYGMNKINEEDFWYLVDGLECEIVKEETTSFEEEFENIKIDDNTHFTVNCDNGSLLGGGKNSTSGVTGHKAVRAVHIDYIKLNKLRKNIGTLGELLVMEYENERLKSEGLPYEAVHVAKTIGDGLGYDIVSYDKDGKEIHIEVKTTRTANVDGFYMSRREIEESQNSEYPYKIYRLYNLDEKDGTVDLKIYEGSVTSETFYMTPVSYVIKEKG